ncbi:MULTISPECIES: type II/III secretion system family protein [Paraburkholderia]|uniref:type II/III secretion system family protein n=1 Tax=Paraburkholderia TaxID=1822464 RepID=UPI0022504BF6|nr:MULTISPECIES: type II/III secretion system family protein [Paraburkholderia]MCX4161409.1 type II/III secretion system family protein [Paraburkholderia megapolitana]MDN7156905.1 type II/III secretion system family protein [Paraburkholderia sp. CHISQ3]MDQ6493950.1 type II/III secretion system family protein [Paraburkholderia megapolitana]
MSIRILLRCSMLAGVLAVAMGSIGALGAPGVNWQGSRFVYDTNGSSLVDTLNAFSTGQNVPIRMSGNIQGTVHGHFVMPPRQFLDTICARFDLDWYYDGTAIQISPISDEQTLAIRLNYLTPDALAAGLAKSGVTDARFPLQFDPVHHTVVVKGPAAYIAQLSSAAGRLELDAQARTRTTVKVVRLQSALAADQVRSIGGHDVIVQGVATLLQQRFMHGRLGTDANQNVVQPVEFAAALPIVEADASTNSVLIRDKPERIDGDAVLVADLDTRPKLVSVEAWVVDVNRDALAELGATLPLAATSGDAGAGSSDTPGFATATDGGHDLVVQLHALEQAQRAHTEVSRTMLTLDGTPAVIDRHEARLALREGDVPDSADNLWLSVKPTLDAEAAFQRVALRVDLGPSNKKAGDTPAHEQIVAANLAPGECLVIAAPSPGQTDPNAPQRLVLLIPHIAA